MSKSYTTAEARWEGIGPYFAMFPTGFAKAVIESHTAPGDSVVDPFAGRGTALFAAAARGRDAFGVEINPVGWVYSKAKLSPAPLQAVEQRLTEIADVAQQCHSDQELPYFFTRCFAPSVLRFLIAARSALDWRHSDTDWTLAALLLVYLHGKRESSLSNQMMQSKAMSPPYAIRWWDERGLHPPERDVCAFMLERIRWRYQQGLPELGRSVLLLGDSESCVAHLAGHPNSASRRPFSLLFTSPPYMRITNYHYDQWLRLWLLGGEPEPRRGAGPHRRRFGDQPRYQGLISRVFQSVADLSAPSVKAYVRVDSREPTFTIVHDALRASFPKHRFEIIDRPLTRPTQTALFGDRGDKPGDRDIVAIR